MITPFKNQAYFGQAPYLSSMQTFGSTCYFWISKGQRTSELNGPFTSFSTARRGLFVGYDEHRRAYMVLPDGGARVVLSRSVVFDERVVVQRILGFCSRNKDGSNSAGQDEDVSASIRYIQMR